MYQEKTAKRTRLAEMMSKVDDGKIGLQIAEDWVRVDTWVQSYEEHFRSDDADAVTV